MVDSIFVLFSNFWCNPTGINSKITTSHKRRRLGGNIKHEKLWQQDFGLKA